MSTHAATLSKPAVPAETSRCPVHRAIAFLRNLMGAQPKSQASSPTTGRCPLGFDAPGDAFTNHAEEAVNSAPVLPGDPAADALLAEARASIYHWPADFPGFSCDLEVMEGEARWTGRLTARSSRDYQIEADSSPPGGDRWLRYHLEEFLAHREHPHVSRMAARTGVRLGDHDLALGTRLDFLRDPMGSYYRIKDRRITVIGRSYPKQSFVITISRHLERDGRFAATDYTAVYWDRASGQSAYTESYRDDYADYDGFLLPSARLYTRVDQGGQFLAREIRFHQPTLLSPALARP